MTRQAFDGIASVAGAIYRADRARMAELTAQEQRLVAQLADIDRSEAGLPQTPIGADFLAEELWRRWVQSRRDTIMGELLKLRARRADLMEELRRSFGRATAAEEAARRAGEEARRIRQRRLDWGN